MIAVLARALIATAAMTAACAPAPAQARQPQERVNPQAKALADFREEVDEYVELHKKLEAKLPDLPKEATPFELDQRQRALAALIQTARKGAAAGDIFERDSRPIIRKLLYAIFTGPDGKRLRASINEENPGQAVKLTINGRYPDSIPVSTVPPQVLGALPHLPPELEYRFIGTTLILLDAHAHIIVDYMTGVVPR
jgi:hypothetical protein